MTVENVKRIINEEKLTGYNLLEERDNKENEINIVKDKEKWIVFATDERASKVSGSEKEFVTMDEALDNFIKRLRAINILR